MILIFDYEEFKKIGLEDNFEISENPINETPFKSSSTIVKKQINVPQFSTLKIQTESKQIISSFRYK